MKDKNVWITGGGRGIGAATAKFLVRMGAHVCISSRTESELNEVAADIRLECPNSGSVTVIQCDLASVDSIHHAFVEIQKQKGPVDCLVNAGAIAKVESFENVTPESFMETVSVNLGGSFFTTQELFKQNRKLLRKGGAVVMVSSLGGLRGTPKFPGLSAYSMSKFGIVGLTEVLAVEGKELGIRVNCVAPGAVDTRMLREAAPHLKTDTKPEDIAQSIYFLLDDSRSKKISGSVIEIHSNL